MWNDANIRGRLHSRDQDEDQISSSGENIVLTDRIKKFLDSNSLSLNLGKTEIVETMVRQKRVRQTGLPPQLSVRKPDGTLKIILAKDLCRLLGANLNRDATWGHQLNLGDKPILKGLRSVLGALTHVSKHLPQKSRLLLANGCIHK